jgi:hypothetical protein
MYRDGNVVICGKVGAAGKRVFVLQRFCMISPPFAVSPYFSRRLVWATIAAFGSPTATHKVPQPSK